MNTNICKIQFIFILQCNIKIQGSYKVTYNSGYEEFPVRSLSQKTVLAQSDIHVLKCARRQPKTYFFDTTRIESTTQPVTPQESNDMTPSEPSVTRHVTLVLPHVHTTSHVCTSNELCTDSFNLIYTFTLFITLLIIRIDGLYYVHQESHLAEAFT